MGPSVWAHIAHFAGVVGAAVEHAALEAQAQGVFRLVGAGDAVEGVDDITGMLHLRGGWLLQASAIRSFSSLSSTAPGNWCMPASRR